MSLLHSFLNMKPLKAYTYSSYQFLGEIGITFNGSTKLKVHGKNAGNGAYLLLDDPEQAWALGFPAISGGDKKFGITNTTKNTHPLYITADDEVYINGDFIDTYHTSSNIPANGSATINFANNNGAFVFYRNNQSFPSILLIDFNTVTLYAHSGFSETFDVSIAGGVLTIHNKTSTAYYVTYKKIA